ncbi:MAG: radical SAM protein [Krumholzibacteria bacterium]|nr:radical SAM protein [Candidatus Krumholzibacteria bacterium]
MSLRRHAYEQANRLLLAGPAPLRRAAVGAAALLPFARVLPRFMMVEPTNACDLACPLCPVGARTMTRARGFLDPDAYRGLLDEVRTHVRRILMIFAGEPLLHPRIGELIAATNAAGIHCGVGTHGNLDRMQEIVDAGVDAVLFALDGTTQATYGVYRRGGSLDTALANLARLVAARDRRPGGGPAVTLQMVVMRHNVHQVGEFVRLGADAGVDAVSLRPVCVNDFFGDEPLDLAERWTPPDDLARALGLHRDGWRGARPPLCEWPLQSVVLHNGDVTVCCYDADGRHVVGNAFREGFATVWHGAALAAARRRVVRQSLPLCARCDLNMLEPVVFDPRQPPAHLLPALDATTAAAARG